MMIKRLLLACLTILILSSASVADIYRIPEDTLAEIIKHKQQVKENPESNKAKFDLAMSYAYSGQIQKGWGVLKTIPSSYASTVVNTYTKKQKRSPKEWKHPFKLAFGYYFEDKKDKAIASFEQVLAIDPNHVWAMGFIALLKGEEKKYDDTIDICKKALSIEPKATAIHFLIAEAYRKKGNYWPFVRHMAIMGRLQTEEALIRAED